MLLDMLLRTPTDADIDELAANMRNQDIDELHAAGIDDLRKIVVDSVLVSRWSVAMRIDGVLACIIGLAVTGTVLTPVGVPWMLGTPLVPRHGRTLTRLARRYIPRMLATAPHLMNTVHARNTVAVRWLQRNGFRLRAPHRAGPQGELFHVFEMGGTHV